MSWLVAMWLAAAPALCFTPNDATPGWKHVALPDEARSLAGPVGVEQFRSDEWITVVDERSELFLAGEHRVPGRTSFDFALGEGGHSLELYFERPLRGAKVDVSAWGPAGAMTLMHEERVGGATLALSWGSNDVREVTVRVHDHLRQAPVVRRLRTVRRLPATALHESPAFKLAHSLYYRQPVGPAVTLCEEPGRALTLPSGAPPREALPTPVSLRRL